MGEVEIKNFADIFVDHLKPGSKIINIELEKLPPAGYGSIMTRAVVTVKTQNGTKEVLDVVAKLVPAIEAIKQMFQIEHTFKNEVLFYKTIVPTLQNFRKQQGLFEELDCFAKFYGARLSLDKNEVDDDAVLVLENLVKSGFQNSSRQRGFDLDGAKLILRDLAKFQGTAIALKLKQPDIFKEKIRVSCREVQFDSSMEWFRDILNEILEENKDYAHLAGKMAPWPPAKIPQAREPYATVAHGDLWVNNTMQKYENGKIVANKFVDFQGYNYLSCASDVFFFLWTSCSLTVVENHFDYLLKYYHDNLTETLKELHCDTSEFNFDNFLEDMRLESEYEFGHAAMFIMFVKTAETISPDEMAQAPTKDMFSKKLSSSLKEYYCFMFEECDKRGWLH